LIAWRRILLEVFFLLAAEYAYLTNPIDINWLSELIQGLLV